MQVGYTDLRSLIDVDPPSYQFEKQADLRTRVSFVKSFCVQVLQDLVKSRNASPVVHGHFKTYKCDIRHKVIQLTSVSGSFSIPYVALYIFASNKFR